MGKDTINLKGLRKKFNLTQEKLGHALGVSKQYISLVERGVKKLTHKKVTTLKKKYNYDLTEKREEDFIDVDFYPNVFASCGSGSYVLSDNKEAKKISKTLLPSLSKSAQYSICNARGDSMEPTIRNGDYVIVQHLDNEQIVDNEIYIFCYESELFVKRVSKNINQIIINSDNANYDAIILKNEEMEKISIIGKIIGVFYS